MMINYKKNKLLTKQHVMAHEFKMVHKICHNEKGLWSKLSNNFAYMQCGNHMKTDIEINPNVYTSFW